MPTLRELQGAMRGYLLDDGDPMAATILADALMPADRLSIYRNTSRSTLTNALRLAYPAVHRLVGEDFFAAASDAFITAEPPPTAWLDLYGAGFPQFLHDFGPAAALAYLSDVARLEQAVVHAIHAADREPLAPVRLAAVAPSDHARVCFTPHPSVGLLSSDYPVDAIWRAVLAHDDGALSAIDLNAGAVWLLVERRANTIEVTRLEQERWRFAAALFGGRPLVAALEAIDSSDAPIWLAGHLAAGHFADFALSGIEHASFQAKREL